MVGEEQNNDVVYVIHGDLGLNYIHFGSGSRKDLLKPGIWVPIVLPLLLIGDAPAPKYG